MAHVLSLQIAPTRRTIVLHNDLVVGDEVLTVVEVLEGPTHPILDRGASHELLGEKSGGVGNEHFIEIVPGVGVEGPRVPYGEIDDGGPIGQQPGHRVGPERVEWLGSETNRDVARIAGHVVTVVGIGQTAPVTNAPEAPSPLGRPVQIAYAVDPRHDLVEVADRFRATTGAGPFVVARNIEVTRCLVGGRPTPFDHSSAYGWWGETMVELMQEHTPSVIGRTSGVHHLAFMVDDLETALTWCDGNSWPILLDARVRSGTRFVFADARDELGHLVELYERTEALVSFYERVRSLADNVRT